MKALCHVCLVFGCILCITSAHEVAQEKQATASGIELSPTPAIERRACLSDMAEVQGDYCTDAQETCLKWVNADGTQTDPPIPPKTGRCGVFKQPSTCLGRRVHKHFCIDTYEYPNVKGEKPKSWMTWYDMKRACESNKKRLCTRSEWTFACEGPDMKPYPYGDGYHRDKTACNFDNVVPKDLDVMHVTRPDSEGGKILDGMLVPAGSMPRCVSPFGVHDQIGNIDESVVNESGHPYVSGLMSGHVFGVRNACRPMTEIHGPEFSWYETGGRCCSTPEE